MKAILLSSVVHRRSLVIWTLFCVIAGATFLAYALSSEVNGHGEFVMPLDDVYIHFQYARQMAVGQLYVYNPGLPPTSGATSFLYPYVLAIGYVIGFQGLRLGIWAMMVGALALAGAMWLVYKLVRLLGTGELLAVIFGAAFGVSGSVAWHFLSGMETGLVVLFTLGTLYAVIKLIAEDNGADRKFHIQLIVWATALALIRPEGGLLAVVAVVVVWWQRRELTPPPNPPVYKEGEIVARLRRQRIELFIPVLAVAVQPLVNMLLTGSAVASGNAAKSILGTVPFYWDDVIRRIIANFVRMWVEFGTGIGPREGVYIMSLLLVLAAVGIGQSLVNQKLRAVGVMLVLWFLGGMLMLATLDTVFWHFKRYQMPFVSLLFPLAGWGIGVVASYKLQVTRENAVEPPNPQNEMHFLPQRHKENREEIQIRIEPASRHAITTVYRRGAYVIIGGMMMVAAFTSVQFWRYYGLNVGYVYVQPLQMARWLDANTPPDAVIAVHDVGMMRYMGGRTTLDMVGLTTKGAADYWRNGPGAVAEFLMKERPDYIASYGHGHGFGLGMIADTDIYGQALASFPVELDNNANVALAADFQGIYKPDWRLVAPQFTPMQSTITDYLKDFSIQWIGDRVNVADMESEQQHSYQWGNKENSSGFPTVVREMNYVGCENNPCTVVDAGRQINGDEAFRVLSDWLMYGSICCTDVMLVTRVHPSVEGTIDIYVRNSTQQDETLVATKWIPSVPGKWLEIPILIPSKFVADSEPLWIHIVPHLSDGFYEPYNHAVVVGHYVPEKLSVSPVSTFQNGAIQLGTAKLDYQPDKAKLGVNFEWYTDGSAKGDFKVFVHLYADTSKPPLAQLDMRPGNGTLPPGNWLPGMLRDTITVDLNGVPAGTYKVAIGMYDPITFERLQPTGGDEQRRLFIGEVEIKG